MTRLEKAELLKSKGYTYDPETGKIYGSKGFEITRKNQNGYIVINSNYFKGSLKGHHFAWYMIYDNVNFERLDHINTNPADNRISNLRIISHQKNMFNTNAKGFYFSLKKNKWYSKIMLDRKSIHLGYFNTEEEARNTYLEAKKKYHII